MAVLVSFPRGGKIAQLLANLEFDSLMLDGVPEIAVACRRPAEELAYRDKIQSGVRGSQDRQFSDFDSDFVWSIVSTSEFALQKRPRHSGAWDDAAVGDQLVRAFLSSVLGLRAADMSSVRCGLDYLLLTPTFHWHGPACLNMLKDDSAQNCFIFDGHAGVGYCGDVCGGSGPAGAVKSAVAMAERVIGWCELASRDVTVSELDALSALPLRASDWQTRVPRSDEDDCPGGIWGTFTGRREANDGLDHTWEVAAKLNKRLCAEDAGQNAFRSQDADKQQRHYRYRKAPHKAVGNCKGEANGSNDQRYPSKSKGKSDTYNDGNDEQTPQRPNRRWTSKKQVIAHSGNGYM